MKKILYSYTVRILATLLLLACVVAGTYLATDAVLRFEEQEHPIYGLEASFENCDYLSALLSSPELTLSYAYHSYYGNATQKLTESFEEYLSHQLDTLWSRDKILYSVSVNDTRWTNAEDTEGETLTSMTLYAETAVDANGVFSYESSLPSHSGALGGEDLAGQTHQITVLTAIRPEMAEELRLAWEGQERLFFDTLYRVLFLGLSSLVLFVYLIAVSGRDNRGGLRKYRFDEIWTELFLFAPPAALTGAMLWIELIEDGYRLSSRLWSLCAIGLGLAVGTIVLISVLSLARKGKSRRLLSTALTVILCRGAWRLLRRFGRLLLVPCRGLRSLLSEAAVRRTGAILCTMLLVYTVIIGACGILTPFQPTGILLALLVFFAACLFLLYRAADLDRIKKGVKEIKEGGFGYQITDVRCEDMKELAAHVNQIGEGLERSVNDKLRAERMKTELITNVSHDLKTPLTSIINYATLLAEQEELSEEERHYVDVIVQKSDHLKKLTRDIFDISKAQSGNEEIHAVTLEAGLLLQQALAEYEEELCVAALTLCVSADKELFFSGDSDKLSRVMGNLLDNILKYSLRGTRVWVGAREVDGRVRMEFKNISSYPLDFDPEEILGRFVRGDESRSTEGSGLGLAIAKTYTELCGGAFAIATDGDLFKAILTFPREAPKATD